MRFLNSRKPTALQPCWSASAAVQIFFRRRPFVKRTAKRRLNESKRVKGDDLDVMEVQRQNGIYFQIYKILNNHLVRRLFWLISGLALYVFAYNTPADSVFCLDACFFLYEIQYSMSKFLFCLILAQI